eukprot:4094586-Karenia_brevis.AAC.1
MQTGTVPVERLWGTLLNFFPPQMRFADHVWMLFLLDLAFLRFNWMHFHGHGLAAPAWAAGDTRLQQRADALL